MKHNFTLTRRSFIRTTAAGSVALGWLGGGRAPQALAAEAGKPALLGGTPVHQGGWTRWPQWREAWEPELLKVWRSGKWFRGSAEHVAEFERGYAQLLGAKRCLATASGTTALMVGLHVMDVDAGDEAHHQTVDRRQRARERRLGHADALARLRARQMSRIRLSRDFSPRAT